MTKHYLAGENSLDDGYWDDVLREQLYFKNQISPANQPEYEKGRVVGEFDVLFVNYEDRNALYKEIKTSYKDLAKAEEQMDRAEEFFEDTDWDVDTFSVLER